MAEPKTKFENLQELAPLFTISETSEETRVLNTLELNALSTLIAYVSMTQEKDVETIYSIFTTTFGVTDVKTLSQARYNEAVQFLVHINLKTILN